MTGTGCICSAAPFSHTDAQPAASTQTALVLTGPRLLAFDGPWLLDPRGLGKKQSWAIGFSRPSSCQQVIAGDIVLVWPIISYQAKLYFLLVACVSWFQRHVLGLERWHKAAVTSLAHLGGRQVGIGCNCPSNYLLSST